jgi:hypothetical protein
MERRHLRGNKEFGIAPVMGFLKENPNHLKLMWQNKERTKVNYQFHVIVLCTLLAEIVSTAANARSRE